MHTRTITLSLTILSLALASLACDLSVGGPTPPASPIPVSTEAAGQLLTVWEDAVRTADGGQVSVTITEEQITSYLNFKLLEQTDPPLRDVQVFLRDGKIQIYGTAKAGSVSTTALISIAVAVTQEGQLKFTVDKADFGPVPVPATLLEGISSALNEAFTGQVGTYASGITIVSAAIADGKMAIVGKLK